MKPINPRPGVAVAITDRFGEIADWDPAAYRRREKIRRERIRKEEEDAEDERRAAGDGAGAHVHRRAEG